jgi:hypothetical protein
MRGPRLVLTQSTQGRPDRKRRKLDPEDVSMLFWCTCHALGWLTTTEQGRHERTDEDESKVRKGELPAPGGGGE